MDYFRDSRVIFSMSDEEERLMYDAKFNELCNIAKAQFDKRVIQDNHKLRLLTDEKYRESHSQIYKMMQQNNEMRQILDNKKNDEKPAPAYFFTARPEDDKDMDLFMKKKELIKLMIVLLD